jgi:hypothetical protein
MVVVVSQEEAVVVEWEEHTETLGVTEVEAVEAVVMAQVAHLNSEVMVVQVL